MQELIKKKKSVNRARQESMAYSATVTLSCGQSPEWFGYPSGLVAIASVVSSIQNFKLFFLPSLSAVLISSTLGKHDTQPAAHFQRTFGVQRTIV